MVTVTADPNLQPENLRAARRQSRAARRAMGVEIEEATVEVLPESKPNTTGVTGMNSRKPSPENPNYTRNGYKAKEGQLLWEATGSSGQIAVRSSAVELTFAIDVADIAATRELAQQGQIWEIFPSEEAAERRAAKLRESGLTVKVVPARPYAGQPNDPQ